MGRATQGVRVINLEKRNDSIASVCCVDTDPEEEVEQVDGEELEAPIVDGVEDVEDVESEDETQENEE
jgi:DNA gyrase subunit A